MTTDVARIASNTGYSTNEIQRIKNFIFMEKHDLGRGKLEYFDASYEMAQLWQRLIDGKNIQQHDLILLKHEIMENKLVDLGIPQSEAHIMTSKEYNYSSEARKYYDTIEKHKKDNETISCVAYSEDCTIGINMFVNMTSEELTHDVLPTEYAYCKTHMHMAKRKLINMAERNELTSECLVMWY